MNTLLLYDELCTCICTCITVVSSCFRGGKAFTVNGTHLNSVSSPMLSASNTTGSCDVQSKYEMQCTYPMFQTTGDTQIVIVMDGIDTSLTTLNITVLKNPFFNKFENEIRDRPKELILDVRGFTLYCLFCRCKLVFIGIEILLFYNSRRLSDIEAHQLFMQCFRCKFAYFERCFSYSLSRASMFRLSYAFDGQL